MKMICNKDERSGNPIQNVGCEFAASGTIWLCTTRFGTCALMLERVLDTEREDLALD
jgi:hypothetical protein